MKRGIIFLVLIVSLSAGCRKESGDYHMTNLLAAEYFNEIEAYCNAEAAQLWGKNLYGPIMIVNPSTREIYANMPDEEGLLKPRDGIYVGTFPRERIMSNSSPVVYGSTMFGMVQVWSEKYESPYRIKSSAVHALFHCFQEGNSIDFRGYDTSHLKERTARMYVKLEWKALQRAIRTSGETRKQAIRDALIFRSARREMYPRYIEYENHFENYEGLTTFTYTLICNNTHDEYVRKLLNYYERVYGRMSYTLSWGFLSGALYGHLLYEADFDFTSLLEKDFDLGALTGERYEIDLPEISRDVAGSLAINYDIDAINREEQEKESIVMERLHRKVSKFVDKPVIFIDLESPYFSYEPEDMELADSLGIIYNTLRVTDNWGRISVDDGGCLVSPNLDFLRVPAKNIRIEKNHITGDGWHLVLNNSWELGTLNDNYIVKKLIP